MAREITLRIKADGSQAKAELGDVEARIGRFGGASKAAAAALGFVTTAAAVAGTAVAATALGIVRLGERGSIVAGVAQSFDALTRSVGETASAMLDAGRTGTRGLVSDMALMEATNKAILLGLPVTAEEMGTLGSTALALGKAMKLGPEQSMNDLITALGRSSPLILDNLGLTVKVGEANEAYARSLGKSAKELTEQEQKLAFYHAAMDAAKVKVAELGQQQLTFGEYLQKGRVWATNFVDSLGGMVAASPVITSGMQAIADGLSTAFGGQQQQLIEIVTRLIEHAAIGMVQFGAVTVQAVKVVGQAFFALLPTVEKWLAILSAANLAASHLPGVGGMAESAGRALLDAAKALAELNGKGATFSTTMDAVSGTLDAAAAAMRANLGTSRDLTSGTQRLAGAQTGMGSATAATTQAIAAQHTTIQKALSFINSTIDTAYIRALTFNEALQTMAVRLNTVAQTAAQLREVETRLAGINAAVAGVGSASAIAVAGVQDVSGQVLLSNEQIKNSYRTVSESIRGLGDHLGQTLSGMITRTIGWKDGMVSIFQDVLSVFVNQFLSGLLNGTQQTVSQMGGMFQGLFGSLSGMLTGGLIGLASAGVGALVNWVGGIFGGNDTKKDREAFAAQMGFGSMDSLFARLNTIGEGGDARGWQLVDTALNIIGKKDKAANEQWMRDVISVLEAADKKAAETAAQFGAIHDKSKASAEGTVEAWQAVSGSVESGLRSTVDKVSGAWSEIAHAMQRELGGLEFEIPVGFKVGGDPVAQWAEGLPGFAGGTHGMYPDFGSGTPVVLHGRERVMTEFEGLTERSSAGPTIQVTVNAPNAIFRDDRDMQRLGDELIPYIAKAAKRYGLTRVG